MSARAPLTIVQERGLRIEDYGRRLSNATSAPQLSGSTEATFCPTNVKPPARGPGDKSKGWRQMRNLTLLTISFAGLVTVAACTLAPPPLSLAADAILTLGLAEVHAVAAPAPQSSPNVAPSGVARASKHSELAHLAFDGDEETMWSAGGAPSHWIQLLLDNSYTVDKMELVVTQAPAGPTTHEVWLENGSGVWTLYSSLADLFTEDGQTLELPILPPLDVEQVLFLTRDSPSWVAWREIRVFGTLSPKD